MAAVEYSDILSIVEVTTDISQSCKICSYFLEHDKFCDGVNHYIGKHGMILLHVGARTTHDLEGNPWHSTVAILGRSTRL